MTNKAVEMEELILMLLLFHSFILFKHILDFESYYDIMYDSVLKKYNFEYFAISSKSLPLFIGSHLCMRRTQPIALVKSQKCDAFCKFCLALKLKGYFQHRSKYYSLYKMNYFRVKTLVRTNETDKNEFMKYLVNG